MKRKFDWIIDSATPKPQTLWDVDLFDHDDFAVVPSLGALVPGWLLVVPRVPAINFAELGQSARSALEQLLVDVRARLMMPNHTIYEFEHGSGHFGSAMGCGLDQAHLHIVPLNFDLVSAALAFGDSEISWSEIEDRDDPWKSLPSKCEYILVRGASKTILGSVRRPTSQWVRRVIAATIGLENEWDYKKFSGAENVMRTQIMVAK